MKDRDIWYGIVDGLHSNEAFRWMFSKWKSWKNTLWFVTKLKGAFPVKSYWQSARFRSHKHSLQYNVSLKFFDELNNLREEFVILWTTDSTVTNTTVAKTYFGQEYVSRTMEILDSTVVRISTEAWSTLGLTMNSDNSELFKSQDALNDPIRDSHCEQCVFRNFVKLHSLYNCSAFMSEKTKQVKQAHGQIFYRVIEICRLSGFGTVQ